MGMFLFSLCLFVFVRLCVYLSIYLCIYMGVGMGAGAVGLVVE
jgi:hypothetical protein